MSNIQLEAVAPTGNKVEIKDGWFSETEVLWPGQKFALKVEEVLFHERSDFQDVLVFKSSTYGTVLVLDGVVQLTERDEFSYQEMLTHIAMFSHPNPKRVLIVGGGDGGILREVVRHDTVEHVTMCEIDKMVCDVSKKFMPNTVATAFNDPRVNLVYDDAARFLREEDHGKFDVIICDSSDPVGPAGVLFESAFYKSMRDALLPGGVVATQGECIWLHLDIIEKVLKSCDTLFPTVNYAFTTIPTYPCGQIGFILCSLSNDQDMLMKPKRKPSPQVQAALRYYSSRVHEGAFVLPTFAERVVSKVRKGNYPSLANSQ